MSSFVLRDIIPGVTVTIPTNVTESELLAFLPFKNWLATLQESFAEQQNNEGHAFHNDAPYQLHAINVRSVEWVGPRILFVLMESVVQSPSDPRPLPGIVFLRGGSVAILMILRQEGDPNKRFVVMTQQPRIPAASLAFYEIPAGMIDDAGELKGAAITEIREETGLTVPKYELVNMTDLALRNATGVEGHLQKAMYPSPGGCDEFIAIFLWDRVMSAQGLQQLRGKLTGNHQEREKIQVRLVEYKELWREGARDAKTLAAWALYENLIREGLL